MVLKTYPDFAYQTTEEEKDLIRDKIRPNLHNKGNKNDIQLNATKRSIPV